MLDTNEIFVGAQGFAPSVKLEIISIALFVKCYQEIASPAGEGAQNSNFSFPLLRERG